MVRNEDIYQQAVEFRKRGFTYSEIAKICGVSKSTVSNWLSKQKFSKDVRAQNQDRASRDNRKRINLLQKARKAERAARYAEAVRSAETEFKHYKKDALFVAGLTVYLSQGDMTNERTIRLSSNRPTAQKIFISFLREYCGVSNDSLRLWLLLSPGRNESVYMRRWSRITKVSVANFGKTQFVGNKSKSKPLHFGTLNTIIGNTVLKRKLERWLELATKEWLV